MDIQATWERKEGIAIAHLAGRIDSANASSFEEALGAGRIDEPRILVLDFEEVTYISSAGLRVILSLAKELRNTGTKLALCSLSRPVYDVFSVSGFDQLIAIHASAGDAILDIDDGSESGEDALPPLELKRSVDQDIVADNMRDIAAFSIEKYEYSHDCALPGKTRAKAQETIEKALWARVEKLQQRRQRILADLFSLAENTLNEVLGDAD